MLTCSQSHSILLAYWLAPHFSHPFTSFPHIVPCTGIPFQTPSRFLPVCFSHFQYRHTSHTTTMRCICLIRFQSPHTNSIIARIAINQQPTNPSMLFVSFASTYTEPISFSHSACVTHQFTSFHHLPLSS